MEVEQAFHFLDNVIRNYDYAKKYDEEQAEEMQDICEAIVAILPLARKQVVSESAKKILDDIARKGDGKII